MMWLPNLRQLDEQFELRAICDLSHGLTESLGSYYNVSRRFQDFRELVAEDLDVVIVLTPGSRDCRDGRRQTRDRGKAAMLHAT